MSNGTGTPEAIGPKELFRWYSDEITRYRNWEWKLTGYCVAMCVAIAAVAANKPEFLREYRCAGAVVAALLSAFCVTSYFHVHLRLRQYRQHRADLLEKYANAGDFYKGKTSRWWDNFYRVLFVGGMLGAGVLTVWLILRL